MRKKIYNILSVEDNEPDFALLNKALSRIEGMELKIKHISNGEIALNYIFKKGEFKDVPTPDLIILDINLPKISGIEILKAIKRSLNYKSIPVIMFSTSNLEEDIQKSYNANANSYVIKSFDITTLSKKIFSMAEYWLKISEIPNSDNLFIIEE